MSRSRVRRWQFVLGVAVLGACKDSGGQVPVKPGTHWIVAADLSASRNATQLRDAEAFVTSLRDVVRNGDRLSLLRIYERGLADSTFTWSHDIPAAADPAHPKASDSLAMQEAGRALAAVVTVLFDPQVQGTLQGTDIFATLYRVADVTRSDATREVTLVLVSDMLQSTRELDMERAVPETTWVTGRAREHLLPDLSKVCVVAIGPDVSSARGQRALRFWRAYFRQAGAEFREGNYRNWASSAKGLGCGEPT